jgi:hypothetical protein
MDEIGLGVEADPAAPEADGCGVKVAQFDVGQAYVDSHALHVKAFFGHFGAALM